MDTFIVMEILIIVISIVTVVLEIRKMLKLGFHPITFFVIIVGLYWGIFYGYQLIRITYELSLPSHRVFVRSGILLSMTVFLAKVIRVNRRIK